MSDLKAAVQEVTDQIEVRVQFLKALAFLEAVGKSIGIRLVAQDIRGHKGVKAAARAKGTKRTMSEAARERIAEGQRKRWAKAKRGTKKATKKAAKKAVKRTISAEGRKRIAEAQRARWAKQKRAAKTAKAAK